MNCSASRASLRSSSAAANKPGSVGYFAPKFFRQTFHEYAAESIQHSFWARAYYAMQRAKGKDHHAAVRALAFKWIRIIWKCWQTRTPYNEVVYLENLRKKGSPLLKFATENQT